MTRSLLLLSLLVAGCGVPSLDGRTPTPIGADASHVIPAASREYNAGLADLYESLAVAAESGEIKTVRDAAVKAVDEDKRLRTEYKHAIGDVMETRLGSEDLPADSPAFFREMSTAFRRLSK